MKFFNKFTLENVKACDLEGQKILTIDNLDTKINLFSLLKGDIHIESITADNLDASLYTLPDGSLNIQFLIDLFTPKKKRETPNLLFPLITLNNASFRYNNDSASNSNPSLKNWQFNANNIAIDSLYTQIQFSLLEQSNLDANINYLRFKEKSGFNLNHLSTYIEITDSSYIIPFAIIDLPHSSLATDSTIIRLARTPENKIDWAKTNFKFNISHAEIVPSDLKHFVPELERLTKTASISAKIDGYLDDIKATNLRATYGPTLSISANVQALGLPDIKNTYFKGAINHIRFDKVSIQDLIANISKQPFVLPDEIKNLGTCQYSGDISGSTSNLVLYGNLNTDIGNIKTDVNLKIRDNFNQFIINGRINSKNLLLAKLVPHSGLGNISFNSNSQIYLSTKAPFSAQSKININHFQFNNYNYENISIDGEFNPSLFSGQFLLDDPNGYFYFNGQISEIDNFKKFNFTAKIDHLNLNKLNLIKTRPNLTISVTTQSDFSGDRWATMAGFVNIDSLSLVNAEKSYFLNRLSLNAKNDSLTAASIESDIINGGISGNYTISALTNNLVSILAKSMPILNKYTKKAKAENDITCILQIEPLKPLLQTIEIPWFTTDKTSIYAHLNSIQNEVEAEVHIPNISNGKINIDSVNLYVNNLDNNNISLNLSAGTKLKKDYLNAALNINAFADTITTTLNWDNNNLDKLFAGEFIAQTALESTPNSKSIALNTTILPTELILQNKSWIINESRIWSDLSKVIIDKFNIHSIDNQLIAIDGIASSSPDEIINIQLKDISLDYIDELLPEETAISFGGIVNGNATIANTLVLPEINADVISTNFQFDNSYFGTAIASCNFDHNTTSLQFGGTVINDNADTTAILYGNYFIPNDSLDLKGKANGINVSFIDYYLAEIFGRVKGNAWGDIHIHGYTKKKEVAVDVAAYAENASIYVDFLKTAFYFSDSIFVNKNSINFGHIDVYDAEGHTGYIEGEIKHNYFEDVNLDLNINVNNMLVMNTTRADMESFYGKVYGTGNARIFGDENEIKITCNARSDNGTNVVIPIDNYYASENSFIIFQDLNTFTKSETNTESEEVAETNIVLDLMLDITPDAHLDLIIDSKAGDMLSGSGNGNLRVTYDINADDMKIYGNVQIEQGEYLFTFQNVLRKEFYVKEGSSLSWTGDPLGANLYIDAYYQLTADLAEILDEAVLSNTSRTSVPVQCLLNLTGILTQPNIKFNLNLPNSEEELNRALQNTVNTDELMNRQIIALLILGKFIPPENLQNSNIFTQNELYSVVSSTLSAQLNNWASQIFDNWGFGLNFRTTGEGDTRTNEYEFNFVYTPTNRISINGNLGYRDDALSSTPFISDFDFEYKLNQSGKLRAKAYTHTNDYREFKKGLTTQGIGIVYSENFNNLKELWQSWQTNIAQTKKERIERKEQRKIRKAIRKEEKEKKKAEQQLSENNSKN
ncbi:MAG: translocation/assembly module TamB domain-containing protein [Paludibacteraceae bacterium]|nr:translocation/assembly module TamB domain-containing protein [Paludibacteraceae bacterium]